MYQDEYNNILLIVSGVLTKGMDLMAQGFAGRACFRLCFTAQITKPHPGRSGNHALEWYYRWKNG
jgi:hypothetical protein